MLDLDWINTANAEPGAFTVDWYEAKIDEFVKEKTSASTAAVDAAKQQLNEATSAQSRAANDVKAKQKAAASALKISLQRKALLTKRTTRSRASISQANSKR